MIPIKGIYPTVGSIKVAPSDTTVDGYYYYKNNYGVTRSELQTLMAGSLLDPHATYCITDAVGSTLVIGVFADTTSTIHSGAYQFTTIPNSPGVYDIALDTWTDCCGGGGGSGTVTSVGLSMPSAFSVTGSPVTTAGTLAVTGAGTTSQYIDGTGALQTLPTSSYLKHGTATGTDTYAVSITGVTAYNDGDSYLIRFTNGNTTGSTLNINSLGAKTLYHNNDGELIGGDIWAGAEMLCVYNSTLNGFQVIGTSPNALYSYVTNDDSVTITKGMPVYAFSGTGDRMTVKRAYNTSDATSAKTVGVVASTSIAANQKGFIIIQGLLNGLSILPTSTYSDGDTLYLGATAGTFTKVKPYAPNHLVYVATVTTASNGSAGRMYVRVQNGYELDEIHDVDLISTPPANNDVLTYITGTNNLWKPRSISTILGYTPVAPTRTINTSTPLSGGGDLSADRTISIQDAAADGSTKGAATFTASDFNSSSGLISIDYTNGQAASASNKGFLTSADWTTFNNKQNALTNPVTGTGTNNEIAYFNSTGSTIASLPTATYPSLTELSYVKGVTSAIQTQLNTKLSANQTITLSGDVSGSGSTGITTAIGNNKVTNAMLAGSIDLTTKVTGVLPVANGGTNGATTSAARNGLGTNKVIDAYAALGSQTKSYSLGLPINRLINNVNFNLTSGMVQFHALEMMEGGLTLTGVQWVQIQAGVYTANNNNKIGLYSYSGGTLTLVASSTNDGNLWKATGGTLGSKAFSSTYTTVAGTMYFAAIIYSTSAQTTVPQLYGTNAISQAPVFTNDFTNSAKIGSFITGQTDLPATQAMSGLTTNSNFMYLAVY